MNTETRYPGRWKALGVLAAGVALPTMIGARNLSLTNAQWVNAIYNSRPSARRSECDAL